jgi:hypothetical protein
MMQESAISHYGETMNICKRIKLMSSAFQQACVILNTFGATNFQNQQLIGVPKLFFEIKKVRYCSDREITRKVNTE